MKLRIPTTARDTLRTGHMVFIEVSTNPSHPATFSLFLPLLFFWIKQERTNSEKACQWGKHRFATIAEDQIREAYLHFDLFSPPLTTLFSLWLWIRRRRRRSNDTPYRTRLTEIFIWYVLPPPFLLFFFNYFVGLFPLYLYVLIIKH